MRRNEELRQHKSAVRLPIEAGFNIERSTDGTTFTKIATVGANVTTYSDTGLARSATYSYRVSAFNSGGSSAYSNAATVALVVPAAPTDLTAVVAKKRSGHAQLEG